MSSSQPTMLEAALDYARGGLKVLPLCWPTPDGKCGCGWKHKDKEIGKAPRTMNGLSDASSDPGQVKSWWEKFPQANIGILTGEKNGFWVLDVDKDSGGIESLAELEQEHGRLTTRKYHTGGGGYHFPYKYPQDAKIKTKKVCKGIETRSDGAYIVAPPSLHKSGKRYLADEQSEIEDAPEWLVEMITEPEGTRTKSEPITTQIYEGEGRNTACTRESGRLLPIYKDPEIVKRMVRAYNQAVCVPPLSEEECASTWEKSLDKWAERDQAERGEPPKILSAEALLGMDLPPLIYALPGMIAEGLTIITAKPKAGKSWWVLQLAFSVAIGKNLFNGSPCVRGGVLYMGLEDGLRRLQYRIGKIRDSTMYAKVISREKGNLHIHQNLVGEVPKGLDLTITWPKIDDGCIEYLEDYLNEHPDTRLIVIDIFRRIAKAKKGKGNAYEEDYESIRPIQELATRRRVAIVVVHHNRKASSEDPIDMVSGTFGLTGGVDNVIVIQRVNRGDPYDESKFSFISRDIDEGDLAMRFDKRSHMWSLLGDADTHFLSEGRGKIVDCLKDNGPMSPKDIAEKTGKNRETVRVLLAKMLRDGIVEKNSEGNYSVGSAK